MVGKYKGMLSLEYAMVIQSMSFPIANLHAEVGEFMQKVDS